MVTIQWTNFMKIEGKMEDKPPQQYYCISNWNNWNLELLTISKTTELSNQSNLNNNGQYEKFTL